IMAVMGSLSSYPLMLLGRVVIGITEGPQFGTAIATVKRWYAPREQALGNAIWTIGSPLGSMVGFPLVIFLVAQYGWRASFYVLAALNALVVLPVVWFLLKDNPADDAPPAVITTSSRTSFGEAFRILARKWEFWLLPIFNSGTLIYLWGLN